MWFQPAEPTFFLKFGFSRPNSIFFENLGSAGWSQICSDGSFLHQNRFWAFLWPFWVQPAELTGTFLTFRFSLSVLAVLAELKKVKKKKCFLDKFRINSGVLEVGVGEKKISFLAPDGSSLSSGKCFPRRNWDSKDHVWLQSLVCLIPLAVTRTTHNLTRQEVFQPPRLASNTNDFCFLSQLPPYHRDGTRKVQGIFQLEKGVGGTCSWARSRENSCNSISSDFNIFM